VTTEPTIVQV